MDEKSKKKYEFNVDLMLCCITTESKDKHELFADIVSSSWWGDREILNNRERGKYLYERFVDLYDMIIEEYKLTIEALNYIHICKNQLDMEFKRFLRGEYYK